MAWTGVGSRETPEEIQKLMTKFAALKKDICRTGGANGADHAFFLGARKVEMLLPWKGFNGHTVGEFDYTKEQIEFADHILTFAAPFYISKMAVKKLFRRNVFQVLGICASEAEAKPSKFVLCWTPDGALSHKDYERGVTGGTGIAINVASMFDVPVYNMARPEHLKMVRDFIKENS